MMIRRVNWRRLSYRLEDNMLPALYCHVFGVDPYSMVKDGVLKLEDCKATWLEIERLYENGTFSSGHAAPEHKPPLKRENESSPTKPQLKQLSLW